MESCPTQAVLPLVGLAADKVIRDRYGVGVVAQPAEPVALQSPVTPTKLGAAWTRAVSRRATTSQVSTPPV
ncbi:MAG: hypothetical protein ACQESR_06975 [Planctomycetota bacterium]